MNEKYEYLLVGGGIAGLMMAHQLLKREKRFLLIEHAVLNSSSKVAAGMFNPISGKRMTVNWKADNLLRALFSQFEEMESYLGETFLHRVPIIQAFGNIKESNDFMAKLDQENFRKYVSPAPKTTGPLQQEFGSFEATAAGYVETTRWIDAFQKKLQQNGQLVFQKMDPANLHYSNHFWHLGDRQFEKIIFCEGHHNAQNPYFDWLPFKWCKGQVLIISCKGLSPDYIIKRGVYLVHLREDLFKVGSNFEWNFEDDQPTDEGKADLLEKLKQMIHLPFEVVDHLAGIRPTSRDRSAIIGRHPELANMYIFNGLGTKGILQAPYLASHFMDHLENGKNLHREIDIKRLLPFYPNGQSEKEV